MFLKPMLFIEGVVALHRGSCLYFLELFFFFFGVTRFSIFS